MVVVSAEAWCTEIAGGADAPLHARKLLTERLGGSTPEATMHDLHLLTTELVTNAVIHGRAADGAPIALSVTAERNRVSVSVTDPGGGATEPAMQELDPMTPGGMGLYLVDSLSTRWGVEDAPALVRASR